MKKMLFVVLVGGIAALGYSGLATGGQDPLVSVGERGNTDTTPKVLEMHRAPGVAAERARGGLKVGYFVSAPQSVPALGSASFVARCLGKARVIDGGFNSDGLIYADQLTAIDSKTYAYRVRDTSNVPGTAVFSITCIK